MVIQLMVDRSSSNIEAKNISKIDAGLALVYGVVRWWERRCCVGKGWIVRDGTSHIIIIIVNGRELWQGGHGHARQFINTKERVFARSSKVA